VVGRGDGGVDGRLVDWRGADEGGNAAIKIDALANDAGWPSNSDAATIGSRDAMNLARCKPQAAGRCRRATPNRRPFSYLPQARLPSPPCHRLVDIRCSLDHGFWMIGARKLDAGGLTGVGRLAGDARLYWAVGRTIGSAMRRRYNS
jgi:hypothetical protein